MNIQTKLCLVCSSGGHFSELHSLNDLWTLYDRFWVTFNSNDTVYHLKNEIVYYAFQPTVRNIINFFKNLNLAYSILKKERPHIIISTGAGVGVPFIYIGKMMKIKTIYIESMTRIHQLSLSGKLVYFLADHFLAQWPELSNRYKKISYKGQII